MNKIIVVEDDERLNNTVCRFLNVNGFAVKGFLNPVDALNALYENLYDLIISDIMMPHIDGFDFAGRVREYNENIPILFMTARDDFASKERGYRLGIDDYMVKPVDLNEMVLHIKALLRRANIAQGKKLTVGNLVLDEESYCAAVDGKDIPLTAREFKILFKFLSYPNRAFTRSQILDEFTGLESDGGLRSVDVHITSLRQKIADCTGFEIVTVRGIGYKAVLK